MFSPAPHLLVGVNVERMLIESEWLIFEWAICGEFFEDTAKSAHIIIYLKIVPIRPYSAAFSLIYDIFLHPNISDDLNHLIDLGKMAGADPKFLFLRRLNSHFFSVNELCHEQGLLTPQFHE